MGRLLGINHVALEVGSLDDALAFWERLFGPLTLRGRLASMAFVDLGDQFVALAATRPGDPDRHRHVGIVVDDKEAVRAAARTAGIDVSPPPALDLRDRGETSCRSSTTARSNSRRRRRSWPRWDTPAFGRGRLR